MDRTPPPPPKSPTAPKEPPSKPEAPKKPKKPKFGLGEWVTKKVGEKVIDEAFTDLVEWLKDLF